MYPFPECLLLFIYYYHNNNNKRPLTPKSMPPAGDDMYIITMVWY